jgi:hypothetical protein
LLLVLLIDRLFVEVNTAPPNKGGGASELITPLPQQGWWFKRAMSHKLAALF